MMLRSQLGTMLGSTMQEAVKLRLGSRTTCLLMTEANKKYLANTLDVCFALEFYFCFSLFRSSKTIICFSRF